MKPLVYSIEQFPKNKDENPLLLSKEQKSLRLLAKKKHVYGETFTCKCCLKTLSISEFYIKSKITGRRSAKCRDCELKQQGVIEIGKRRFSEKIFKKGFYRCTTCKRIQPLSEYTFSSNNKWGKLKSCKTCNTVLHRKFSEKQRTSVGDYYVKEYAFRHYGLKITSPSDINKYRNEILEKRKPKYFIDGREFVTGKEFAEYIQDKYGIEIATTEKRLWKGISEEDCKLSEKEMRSKAYTKGAIQVTDTVAGKVFIFKNTQDPELLKIISGTAIRNCIRSGKPTRVTSSSKYPNPCTIKRLN